MEAERLADKVMAIWWEGELEGTAKIMHCTLAAWPRVLPVVIIPSLTSLFTAKVGVVEYLMQH